MQIIFNAHNLSVLNAFSFRKNPFKRLVPREPATCQNPLLAQRDTANAGEPAATQNHLLPKQQHGQVNLNEKD